MGALAAGRARRGPTLRECVLMHAVARLALPNIRNIQARLRGAGLAPCSVPCWHAAPAGGLC